jgi:protein SCO1/2
MKTCPNNTGLSDRVQSKPPLDRRVQRRHLLRSGLAAWALLHGLPALAAPPEAGASLSSHFPFGPVVPARPLAAMPVLTHQGLETDLVSLLRGRVSAVHLMFTVCSATCPLQGALFAQAQQAAADGVKGVQFVSISIDPLSDTPAALQRWLTGFQAMPGWVAVRPRPQDLDRLIALLGEGGETRPAGRDPHTGQVYLVDRRARLVYRTPSMPSVQTMVSDLRRVAAL